ncbi:amino acid permease/ SLC12A domain-containing protein [Xylariomycetidae sp. FL2044]|nr:amino acid permease/ SLC12A domain-containing protein [Xylariomycetidae sp. FL2044]
MTPALLEGEKRVDDTVTSVNGSQTTDELERGEGESGGGGGELQRGLAAHHLQFIAIGGTIGTGLFLGSGEALATAGPAGCLIAFVFVGTIVYSVMTSLGEMASFIPVAGSFTAYASRFVDPSLGFALGWIYWFSWAITFALELVAAGVIIQYWDRGLSLGIFIAVFWLVFTALNFLPVRWFGEVEMWFSSVKVLTIVGFILFAICIDAGAGREGYIGFAAWRHPGAFAESVVPGDAGRFVGFWSVLVTAGFSYQGAELVGVGAGETRDPARNVPSAIRWTFWGVVSLFVSTIFFVGLLVPSDDAALRIGTSDASASPLVIAANLAGVPVLPHIINAVLLTAVLSAANSNVYSGSRILVALAQERHAPALLRRINRFGTPYAAVAATAAVGLLAFLRLSSRGGDVFDWLLNITGIAGFITWSCISICHLRFQKALAASASAGAGGDGDGDGVVSRASLPYRAPLQPWLAYYGLFFCVLILLTNGFTVFIEWSTSDFFAAYISLILFLVLFIGHKIVFRTRPVRLADVDLVRDRVKQ